MQNISLTEIKKVKEENYKEKYFKLRDELEISFEKLNKIEILLNHLIQEYDSNFNLDTRLISDYTSMTSKDFIAKHQNKKAIDKAETGAKWIYDYNKILKFIDMAIDYNHNCKKSIQEALDRN